MNAVLDLIPKEAFKQAQTGKFESKLNFAERCAILGLEKSGVSRPVLALAFSVNRRTVTHICNPNGVHYRDVRKEFAKLGQVDFVAKYVTETEAKRVTEAVHNMPKEGIPARAPTPGTMPSRRADRFAGIQVVKPEQCSYTHRLEVAYKERGWYDGEQGDAGWYYRDLDSNDPDTWLHNGPDSLMSSQACLKAAEANLTDE